MVRNLLNQYRLDRSAFSVGTFEDVAREERVLFQSMSPQQRMEVLEYLRQVNYGYDACSRRLQRVLEIVDKDRDSANHDNGDIAQD